MKSRARPTAWSGQRYRQVDVFADGPLSGNGLGVFWQGAGLGAAEMQALATELRQFESVFLSETGSWGSFRARIFTMEEELDFAGHPILGAAAVLHEQYRTSVAETWSFQLTNRLISVRTERKPDSYFATMFQPPPSFVSTLEAPKDVADTLRALNLQANDLHPGLPLEVVSTGLPYVIVPVRSGLETARISVGNLEDLIGAHGAKFLYIYDVVRAEGRTWDNRGIVEDIATGSAAGPVAAYLCKHGLLKVGQELTINQGKGAGRPSRMKAKVLGTESGFGEIEVSGEVHMVSTGVLD